MSLRENNQDRQYIIMGVFIAAALLLIGRAAQLQLFDPSLGNKATAMTIERSIQYPARGVIYDRNNTLLVYNNPTYDIMATYKQIDFLNDTAKVQRFCRLLSIDTTVFRANLNKDWKKGFFNKSLPFPFLTLVTPRTFTRFQESLYEFPGFFAQLRHVRGYPQHNAGHVLGYLGEVGEKMLRDSAGVYESGDYIGTTGLEKYYEAYLRGKKGVHFILKDNVGRFVGPWKDSKLDTAAVEGKDLISTIDLKLQALGEKLMSNKIGAIVAIEPKTGEILAMVTSPTFDPNQMVASKDRSNFIAKMLKDTLKPMFDRSVTAEYAPGSTFKAMMAVIALNMGVWDKDRGVECNQGYYYNGRRLTKCHAHTYAYNLESGVEHSCNAYFCTLYRAMIDRFGVRSAREGLDSLNDFIYRFGMGNPLGIDFPAEKDGNIPTSKHYDKVYKKDKFWYSTAIVSNGIGQGENQLTTMQMANLSAIFANRGWFMTPHLIRGAKETTDSASPLKQLYGRFSVKHSTAIDPNYFEPVVRGMRRVIESGTGSNANVEGLRVCGKTGTVQNPHGEDSSVFIGFAPEDDPKIAVAVYVENGGWGNEFAAPITGLMIEQFLKGAIPVHREALVERVKNAHLENTASKGLKVVH